MYSVLCYTIVGGQRMRKRTDNTMWSRVSKKNIVKWLGWSVVNVTLYVYILNNLRHQRKTNRM